MDHASIAGGWERRADPAWLRRVRDPLDLVASTPAKSWAMLAAIAVLAVAVGIVTTRMVETFADRPLFLLALPMVFVLGVALVLDAKGLLLGLVLLRAALNPIFDAARLPTLGGLGALLNLGIIGLAGLLALQASRRVPRIAWLPWVPFLAIVFVNTWRSPDWIGAQRAAAVLVTYAAVYYAAFHCVRSRVEFDRILRWFLLSSLPVFVYTVGWDLVLRLGDPDGRLKGPMPHPNILGFYCVINLAAWLAKTRATPGAPPLMPRPIGWWLYLLFLLAILAGTQSRNAWIGAAMVFAFYGLFVHRGYLVVMVIGALAALAIPEIRDRLFDITRNTEVYTWSTLNSYAWRKYLWQSALAWMTPMSYITGNGLGSFMIHSVTFFPLAGRSMAGAHNVWLELLFEVGAFGVLAYAAIFAIPAWTLWKARSLPDHVRVSATAMVVTFAFMSYGDNMLAYLVANWPFWFFVGIATSLAVQQPGTTYRRTTRMPPRPPRPHVVTRA